jgi:hypothetical protein
LKYPQLKSFIAIRNQKKEEEIKQQQQKSLNFNYLRGRRQPLKP